MSDAYFTTTDGDHFVPTDHARGPWAPDACHAGPPTALLVRAMERVVTHQRLVRITVELMRPVPMAGFRVQAEIRRPGRSVTLTEAEIFDDERIYARAHGMHLRQLEGLDCSTVVSQMPNFEAATPGPFPIRTAKHDRGGFIETLECRYDPDGGTGAGGPTTIWVRTRLPVLADEEPSPFQRICPLADSGNGISYNDSLDKIRFPNTDLSVSIHREPVGDWFCSSATSHWHQDGTGLADAELFDTSGPVGRALQHILLTPAD